MRASDDHTIILFNKLNRFSDGITRINNTLFITYPHKELLIAE